MPTQFRFVLYVGGAELPGNWRDYNLADMLKDCEAFAINGVCFTVEFVK